MTSKKIDDGGAAFPRAGADYGHGGNLEQDGMTLRQWYAGLAMQGLLSANATYGGQTNARSSLASDAVAHADALIAELHK